MSLHIVDGKEITDAEWIALCHAIEQEESRSPAQGTVPSIAPADEETAKAIDMSGVYRMSSQQLREALREFGEAA